MIIPLIRPKLPRRRYRKKDSFQIKHNNWKLHKPSNLILIALMKDSSLFNKPFKRKRSQQSYLNHPQNPFQQNQKRSHFHPKRLRLNRLDDRMKRLNHQYPNTSRMSSRLLTIHSNFSNCSFSVSLLAPARWRFTNDCAIWSANLFSISE